MSAEYTPTTAAVRAAYCHRGPLAEARVFEAAFERWLAGVVADAREEGYADGWRHHATKDKP